MERTVVWEIRGSSTVVVSPLAWDQILPRSALARREQSVLCSRAGISLPYFLTVRTNRLLWAVAIPLQSTHLDPDSVTDVSGRRDHLEIELEDGVVLGRPQRGPMSIGHVLKP